MTDLNQKTAENCSFAVWMISQRFIGSKVDLGGIYAAFAATQNLRAAKAKPSRKKRCGSAKTANPPRRRGGSKIERK